MKETFRKLYRLLPTDDRRKLVHLFMLMVLLGMLEVVGTASIMPIIMVVADKKMIASSAALSWLYTVLGFERENAFICFLGSTAFLLVVAGFLLRAYMNWVIARFVHLCTYKISLRLLRTYLSQSYRWFLNRHTSDMGRKVLSEAHQVSTWILMPAIQNVANITVCVFLTALIVKVNPGVAATALLFIGGAYSITYALLGKKMLIRGKQRTQAQETCYRVAQEALGGIKEIKIMGLEKTQVVNFHGPARHLARAHAAIQIMAEIPGYIFQSIAFGGMLLLILFMVIVKGEEMTSILPLLALYAFAGVRIIPAFQRTYAGLTNIRSYRHALQNLYDDALMAGPIAAEQDIHEPRDLRRESLREQIEFRDVTFSYPNSQRPTIDHLNFSIRAHTRIGIVGGTGAGKTTVADLLLGLLDPDTGQILIDGKPLTTTNLRAWQNTIGYVPQHIFLIDDSISRNIAFGVPESEIDHQRVEEVARIAEMSTFIAELPEQYDTRIGEGGVRLSGGQRQRIGIARALYHRPDVLVFDEATSALDNQTENAVLSAIRRLEHDKTIIVIAHRLNTIKDCDEVFFFRNGKLAGRGTYDELLSLDEFKALTLGTAHPAAN